MSFRTWRLTKDPLDTLLAVGTVLSIGLAVAVLGYAVLAAVFG